MDAAAGMMLAFAWLLVRVPFYECRALPLFWHDSYKYLDSAFEIWQGALPRFYNHSPLYALVLAATMASGYLATLLFQSLLSLGASVVFVLAARRWSSWLVLPASLAMALQLLHPRQVVHETSLLSEAVYAPLLLLGFGCLIWGIATERPAWYALAGLSCGLAIAAHDAGHFLLVIALLASGHACLRGRGWKGAAALLAPLAAVMGSLQAYNVATQGAAFTHGACNLALTTVTWWQTSEEFPEHVNEYVRRARARVPPDVRSTLDRSWEAHQLRAIYARYCRRESIESRSLALLAQRVSADRGGQAVSYADLTSVFRGVALNAIRSRPDLYAKFVCTQMRWLFLAPYQRRDESRRVTDEAALDSRAVVAAEVLDPERLSKRLATVRRFADAARDVSLRSPPTAAERRFYAADVESLLSAYRHGSGASRGFRPYDWLYVNVLRPVFYSPLWAGLPWASLAISAWVWLASRGANAGALLVLLLALGRLGAGLLVSLVGFVMVRYSVPTESLALAAVLLLPMLWIAPMRQAVTPSPREPG